MKNFILFQIKFFGSLFISGALLVAILVFFLEKTTLSDTIMVLFTAIIFFSIIFSFQYLLKKRIDVFSVSSLFGVFILGCLFILVSLPTIDPVEQDKDSKQTALASPPFALPLQESSSLSEVLNTDEPATPQVDRPNPPATTKTIQQPAPTREEINKFIKEEIEEERKIDEEIREIDEELLQSKIKAQERQLQWEREELQRQLEYQKKLAQQRLERELETERIRQENCKKESDQCLSEAAAKANRYISAYSPGASNSSAVDAATEAIMMQCKKEYKTCIR